MPIPSTPSTIPCFDSVGSESCLVLDLDECVQDHGATCFQIDGVLLQEWFCLLIWIISVDPEIHEKAGLKKTRGMSNCTYVTQLPKIIM